MPTLQTLVGVWVVCAVVRAHRPEDADADDFDDDLTSQNDVYPLRGLKERRGLDYCETHPNPCSNGGTCCGGEHCGGRPPTTGRYVCRCKRPYTGQRCQKRCPVAACWVDFYTKSYNNGRKRALSAEGCKEHVDLLEKCLKDALRSRDLCNCDVTDRRDAFSFDKERKAIILERQCGGGSGVCKDPEVHACARKIYSVGGAIDSTKHRTETERCSLVDEAVSCMKALTGNQFTGCGWNRKLFTEKVAVRHAEWRTWCMGKYCSLYGCGKVEVPEDCSPESVKRSVSPVVSCIQAKVKACLPDDVTRLQPDMDDVTKETTEVVEAKCHLHKQLASQCSSEAPAVKSLRARELLRELLEQTLGDN